MDATVTDIQVERERAVTLTFDDGVVCELGLEELRVSCPCASCRSFRDRGEPSWPRPGSPATLAITDAELVGAWGLRLSWSDGHATGIYPWDALHAWCEERTGGPATA
jgi:DUF971 family protein